ncbi:MAG: hypothetical protein CMJ87_00135 [Planctomycetes bacterium]|nr:hypothetical protein [Planctomycetota bacterium]
MTHPRRILIIRLSHLGDVVQALPLYHALAAAYPGAELAWAVQDEFSDLINGLPGLERVITFNRKGSLRAWATLREDLAAFSPDWTVDAQGNSKSALVALASGARRRTGLAREHWREGFAAGTCTDLAPTPQAGAALHGLERVLALARHCVGTGAAPLRRDPALTPTELAAGRRVLTEHVSATGHHSAPTLLHLSRSGDPRSWPAEHFASLAQLLGPGSPVLSLAGPAEGAEAAIAEAAGVPVLRQNGQRALAALFAAAAQAGGRLVACDSAPAHLAAAVDLPVTLLAGPQDEHVTGPWPADNAISPSTQAGALAHSPHSPHSPPGPPATPATASAHRTLRRPDLHCAPCRARICAAQEGPRCMLDLLPATVAAALEGPSSPSTHSSSDQPACEPAG